MQPFLAMITPVGNPAYPDNTLPGQPPVIDNTLPGQQPGIDNSLPPFPSFPIYIPITPPPVEGQPPEATHPIYIPVYPDNSLPGNQPYPDQGLPGNQPYPDQGLPGDQPRPSHPIYYPIFPGIPTHPIVIPPEATTPAEIIAALQEKIEFWLGNLPPPTGGPEPTPVAKKK